jgi:hypothetical protein
VIVLVEGESDCHTPHWKLQTLACLTAEFERNPSAMKSAKLVNMRALQTDLGFDASVRTRMNLETKTVRTPASKFFND